MPKKITIVLGPLADPLAERLIETSETSSQLVRRLIAAELNVQAPSMPAGNPQAANAVAVGRSRKPT